MRRDGVESDLSCQCGHLAMAGPGHGILHTQRLLTGETRIL
jgi:hypothetical protein